jgi:restriction system protein
MGRRRSSGYEDLFELTAMVPWWVGVTLAIVFYFGLHYLAVQEIPAVKAPHDPGAALRWAVIRGFASAFQYVLPVICIAGAIASAISRFRRQSLVTQVQERNDAGIFSEFTWQEFEALLSEAFKLKGYSVTERGGARPDGGVDLVLRTANEKTLVQCKHWRAAKVPVQTVRELFGVMAAEGADHGYVVASGRFTSDALDFARGRNIELLDGAAVLAMFDMVQKQHLKSGEPRATPDCPECNKPMVRRTAKHGTNAGREFWGCTGYPACRGTRSL